MKRPLFPFLLMVAAAFAAHAQITWTNTAGGNWSVAANWNPNQVPGPSDTAIITNDGTYTVTISANAGVNNLSLGGDSGTQTLSIAGGTFTLNGTATADSNGLFILSGGTILDGAVAPANGAAFIVSSGTLNGVTVNGGLDVGNTYSNAELTVTNGLTLNGTALVGNPTNSSDGSMNFYGTQTLSGNGTVVFGNNSNNTNGILGWNALWLSPAGTTLTIGSGITVEGQNGTIGAYAAPPWSGPANVSVINQGTISATVSGGEINILATPFSNQGLVESPVGTLNLGGTLTSLGNIQSGNGLLSLSGVLTNTSQTLTLNGPTNTLTFNGGTILGGTIAPANGAAFIVQIGTFNGVTFNGTLDVGNTYSVGELTVTNGLTLNGTILVGNPTNSTWGSVSFHGSQTLGGSGTVVFGNNNSNSGVPGYNALRVWMSGTTLTIGSGITVEGQNGTIGAYAAPPWYGTPNVSVINQGTISANVSGGLINILAVPFTNQGSVESPAGQLTVSDWLNTGQTITVGTNTGSLNLLTTTIQGGTIIVSNGVSLVMSGISKFDGVTVYGLLDVGNTYNAAQLAVTNGLTLNGTALVGNPTNGNYGSINFYGTQTLSGNGTVVFGNNSNNTYGILGWNALWVSPAGATLTIGSGITVEGQNGTIGAYNEPPWYGPANVNVINMGTILANANGGTINLAAQPFQNMGTLTTAGGQFSGGPLAGTISATNGNAFAAGSLTFSGVTFIGTLDVGNTHSGAMLIVTNGLTLNGTALVGNPTNGNYGSINFYGTQTLSGNGTVVFGNNSNNTYGILGWNALWSAPAGVTLTIGSGITVEGQNGTIGAYNEPPWYGPANISVTNLGTIQANVSAGTINVAAQPFLNMGTMATAGGGAFSGGTVEGSIWATNGIGFAVATLTFSDVNFNGTLDVGNTRNGAQLEVTNGLTLNGTALVGNPTNGNYGSINFYGKQTLTGNGTVVFGNNSNNTYGILGWNALMSSPAGTALTIDSGITVEGQNGTIGAYTEPPWYGPANVSVTNLGTVLANVNGGTVNLAAQPFLNIGAMGTTGGAFSGGTVEGTVTVPGGDTFAVTSLTFNGVTFNGTLDVGNTYNGAVLLVTNGLTLNGTALVGNPTNNSYGSINFYGTQTLGGNGTVVFGNNNSNDGIPGYNAMWLSVGATTLTIGSGITVEGQNGTIGAYSAFPWGGPGNVSVTNKGTISASVSGGDINILAVPFSNEGSVESPAGLLTVSDWLNTGHTITVGTNSGSLNFSGGSIDGGTIIASNASLTISGNSTFNKVTVDGVLDVGNTYSGAQLTVTNGLTLNGTALVGNPTNGSYGSIDFYGTQTLSGSGAVVFGNNNNYNGIFGFNALWLSPAGTALTISSGFTVEGQNGTIGAYTAPPWYGPGSVSVTNKGIISTTIGGGTIGVNAQPIVNKNIIDAETGTLLVEGTNLVSDSTMEVGINGPTNNGQINFSSVAYFGGTLQAHFNAGYIANIGAKFTLLDYLSNTGAFAHITLPAADDWQVNTGMTTLTITATKIVVPVIPVITSQPQSQSAVPGSNVTFTVTAANAPPFYYQWQFDGTNLVDGGQIVGSQSNILTIAAAATNDVGSYQVIVTNAFGSVTSSVATLTLEPVLTWTNPAPVVYGTALDSSELNATASVPGTFAYTPMAGTVPDAGINLLTVVFTPADTVNYADVTDTVSLTVQPAPLTVTANNASRAYGQNNPAFTGTLTGVVNGDNITANYSCAAVSYSPPGSYPIVPTLNDPGNRLSNYSVTTNNGTLTVTAGAPPQLTSVAPPGGATNGGTSVTITGSGFELGAGVLFGGQAVTGVSVNSGTQITASTPPAPLETVSVTVTNPDGTTATLMNAFTYTNPLPVIQTQPASLLVLQGSNAMFQVTATAASGYQWQFDGTNLVDGGQIVGSASNILAIAAAATNDVGSYQVIVTNAFGSVTSTVATLTLEPILTWTNPAPVVYGTALGTGQLNATASVPGTFVYTPVAGTVLNVGTTVLMVVFTPADTVDYVNVTNTVSLTVQPAPLTVTANNASRAYGQNNPGFTGTLTGVVNGDNITANYSCAAVSYSPPGSYPIVPTLNDPGNRLGNYSVTTNDGALTVSAGAPPQLTSVAPSGGATNGGTSVTITGSGFELGAGVLFGGQAATGVSVNSGTQITASTPPAPLETVSVTVTNPDGTTATLMNAFTYTNPLPVIETQPASLLVLQGSNAMFQVTATGASGYQWQFNGTNLVDGGQFVGSASNILTIAAAATNDVGSYQLIVTNAFGSVTSAVATLTLEPVLTWTTPAPIVYGTALGTGQLNATASVPGTFVYTPVAGTVLNVGTTQLTVEFTPADSVDYVDVTNTVSLTVQQEPLMVTANNASRAYGQNNPAFTGTLMGVVNGDNITANYSCAAVSYSPPGSYSIVPTLNDPGNRLGNYSVATNDGTLTVTAGAPPQLTSVAPPKGATNGNTAVTITGSGFEVGAGVQFGGQAATGVSVSSGTNITAFTPAAQLGTVSVTVTNPDGTMATLSNAFTYVGASVQVALGSTAVQIGQTGAVSVTLISSVALTNLNFTVINPSSRFINWTFVSSNSAIQNPPLQILSSSNVLLNFNTFTGQTLASQPLLGTLYFTPLPGPSAILPLAGSNILGTAFDGTTVRNANALPGSIAVIGAQPLLEAGLGSTSTRTLTLFGNPGNYEIISTTNLATPNWQIWSSFEMTNLVQPIIPDQTSPEIFYRALAQP